MPSEDFMSYLRICKDIAVTIAILVVCARPGRAADLTSDVLMGYSGGPGTKQDQWGKALARPDHE